MKISTLFCFLFCCLAYFNAYAQESTSSDTSYSSPHLPVDPFVEVRSYVLNQYDKEYRALGKWYSNLFILSLDANSMETELSYFDDLSTLFLSRVGFYPEYRSIIEEGQIVEKAEVVSHLSASDIKHLFSVFDKSKFDPDKEPRPDTNCMHVFRDALVFFDQKGEIVGKADFCFTCDRIKVNDKYYYPKSNAQWKALKDFFKRTLGHHLNWRP